MLQEISFSKLISISAQHSVRLACVRHAASVRPEPGSNSLKKFKRFPQEPFRFFVVRLAFQTTSLLRVVPFT